MGSGPEELEYALDLCTAYYDDCELEWFEDESPRHTREIEWSPTGRWLAFSTDRYPLADDDDEGLYAFDLVTHETVQLSQERTQAFAFSPLCK